MHSPKGRGPAEADVEVVEQRVALPEVGGAAGALSPGSFLLSDARLLFNVTH